MKISKLHTFAIISYFFAIRIEASTAERFGYYDPFSDGFLAEGVSSVNVLISEDLQKQLSNVIVAVVFSDTILEPVSDTFCLRSGEVIVEQRVSIPDFLGVNLVRDDNDLYQNKNKINFSYPSETVTSDINIRQSFRIRSNDNGSPFKDSRFYCIGFSLADGQVQIIDFETIRRKMCPNHEPENGKEVFYKTFFTKPILAIDAMRITQKALGDQKIPKLKTMFGYNRASHSYAVELLRAGNLNFPKYLGGWGPTFDYPFISDMTSFLRKMDYADDRDWYKNRQLLKNQLRS